MKSQLQDEIEWNEKLSKTYPDAEYMDTWVWFQSGINTDGAHNPKTTRKLIQWRYSFFKYFPNDFWLLHCVRENIYLLDHAD